MQKSNSLYSGAFLPVSLAWNYFIGGQQNKLISWMSLFSSISFILGIAILILVLSIMNGFEKVLLDRLINSNHHMTVTIHDDISSAQWKYLRDQIQNIEGIEGTTFIRESDALLLDKHTHMPVLILAMDPKEYSRLLSLDNYLSQRDMELLSEPLSLIMGYGISENLLLFINDQVEVHYPYKKHSKLYSSNKIDLKIVDILRVDYIQDYFLCLMSMESFESLGMVGHKKLVVQLKDPFDVALMKETFLRLFSDEHEIFISTWKESFSDLFMAIKVEKTLLLLMMIFLITIAVFGIASILFLFVQERVEDILILKTYGFSQEKIEKIFVYYGLILVLISIVFGVLLGVVISLFFSDFIMILETFLGSQFLQDTFFSEIPVKIDFSQILLMIFILILITYAIVKYAVQFLLRSIHTSQLQI